MAHDDLDELTKQIALLEKQKAELEKQMAEAGNVAQTGGIQAEEIHAQDVVSGVKYETKEQITNKKTAESGAIAENHSVAAGKRGVGIDGDNTGNIVTGDKTIIAENSTIFIGEPPVAMSAFDRKSAMGRYLEHVISTNRHLQLQGIRSGGKLVHIELDRIYITLRATRQRTVRAEEGWLNEECMLAPGERHRCGDKRALTKETLSISINEALKHHKRLAVLGDPGCGKTTLLRYLALIYARDLAEKKSQVKETLELEESGWLPVLMPLRKIGAYLNDQHGDNDSIEGSLVLLNYMIECLKNERIDLPGNFFDEWLTSGRAVILLDGLDEVADPDLRRRVSRLVEAFTLSYAECRYVVTSRIVGYTGAARLGENYTTTTVQDFSLLDIEHFLSSWHWMVGVSQMGETKTAKQYAADQTRQLMTAIRENERILDLAINPLMLTVIALVHRDRVKLPDRRAELYSEAVDVLLGKWDDARGVKETQVLETSPFDAGDKRLMLQNVALEMHENSLKDIDAQPLKDLLLKLFLDLLPDRREAERAVHRFLNVIQERAGILTARGEGVYSFSHLTFQEYLAALAVAARDDYIPFTLKHSTDRWWREVILLEAGFLSSQSKERTTKLIRAIADSPEEPELYHNLVLAAECIRDVGGKRVAGNVEEDIRRKIKLKFEKSTAAGWLDAFRLKFLNKKKEFLERRIEAAVALGRMNFCFYWYHPHGEPEWIHIPAGKFWMGEREEAHEVFLEAYDISRTPITNAQYRLFVKAAGHDAPDHWTDGRIPKGLENHPVVSVTWHDAMAYCKWLSKVTGKRIGLPSEAEWEKTARGDSDQRIYPWGNEFDAVKCNCGDLGLADTTPVGIFTEGASPYGCLDMAGNVWEWTRSLWDDFDYPYNPEDGRENLFVSNKKSRVLRGGAFYSFPGDLRCADRLRNLPGLWFSGFGFRCVCAPVTSEI